MYAGSKKNSDLVLFIVVLIEYSHFFSISCSLITVASAEQATDDQANA